MELRPATSFDDYVTKAQGGSSICPAVVQINDPEGASTPVTFGRDFTVGRGENCDFQVSKGYLSSSKMHVIVFRQNDWWWIEDCSRSCTYLNGNPIRKTRLPLSSRVQLGPEGPILSMILGERHEFPEAIDGDATKSLETTESDAAALIPDADVQEQAEEDPVSEASAIDTLGKLAPVLQQIDSNVRKRHAITFLLVALLILANGGFLVWQQYHNEEKQALIAEQEQLLASQRTSAEEVFVSLKSIDIEVAQLAQELELISDRDVQAKLQRIRAQREVGRSSYSRLVNGLNLYRGKSQEDILVHRVVSRFGEYEFDMPPAFLDSVKVYIEMWKRSGRLEAILDKAHSRGYVREIAQTLRDHDLPQEFFYLAVQESALDPSAVGPLLTKGRHRAKGMWQFIPTTANDYGLAVGKSPRSRQFDPADERHDVRKSTRAAAEYLRFIYTTRARASGLLVMASYNWGEHNVVEWINGLPDNTRERTFWNLMRTHRLPSQTRKYVFNIVALAAIGDNPRLFGFDFDNPLES